MNRSGPIRDGFVAFETTEEPGRPFDSAVFCDFNVLKWRYQFQGVDELAHQIRYDTPNTITVRRVEPTLTEFVLEAEAYIQSAASPTTSERYGS